MNDIERYNHDKAAVMSMVKFILFVALAGVIIYFGLQVIYIIIPFLIGFILAKTSFAIANPLSRLFAKSPAKAAAEAHARAEKNAKAKNSKSAFSRIFYSNPDKKRKSLRTRLTISIYVILLIITLLLVIWCGAALISQANTAITKLSDIASDIDYASIKVNTIDHLSTSNGGFLSDSVTKQLQSSVSEMLDKAVKAIPSILSSIVSWIWALVGHLPITIFMVICVILSGYYFITDGPEVMRFYLRNVPNKSFRKKSMSLLNNLSVTLFRVLGGYLSLLIITAFEAWLIFTIAGVNYAVILSLLTGVIDFLPVLGISATMIPVMVYCGLNGNYTSIIILVVGMALMTIIRRLIEPAILGKSMHLHPLIMLLGMITGVYLWGVIGFLLGPTVLIIILQIIKVFEIDKKIISFMSRVLARFMMAPEPPFDESFSHATEDNQNNADVDYKVSDSDENSDQ